MADGGKRTRIDPATVALVSGSRTEAWRAAGYFPPIPPPPPVAQQSQGRQYDYGQGFNLINTPRMEDSSGVSFTQLRSLADNYDLLRLVIETRKDQLCGLSWNIVGRDPEQKVKADDPRVKELEKFFRRPDGVLSWHDWLRILVEDMLVIDAATVYPRKTVGGGLHSLEIIDGGTIKIIIGEDGRPPLAPAPAYAQIIKGMQASHYTLDELIYKPRNRRSWKQYGYSPVEQIMMTVNIALRRQLNQLYYYTEGNIPEALASCPETWTPDQVRQMQAIWDSLIAANPEVKRHMKFIPGGIDVKFTRDPVLKDTMDEWLARIVAYAFSVSPQALVQLMNRATAETAAESAQLEGLAPLQLWVKDFVDQIIELRFGYDDLVFAWDSGEELDPKTQAEIHKIYVDALVLDVDEVRKDIGRDPREQPATGVVSGAVPASPPVTGSQAGDQLPARGAEAVAAAGAAPDPNASGIEGAVPMQLGPDGQPIPTPVGGEAKVADAAMNGTQVTSLMEIVTQVANKDIPEETGVALIMAAFPSIQRDTIDAMLVPLRNFEPPKPEPIMGPDGKPIAPGAGSAPDLGQGGKGPPPPDATKDKKAVDKEAEKVEKLAKVAPLTARARAQRKKLTKVLIAHLAKLGAHVAEQVSAVRVEQIAKAAPSDSEIKRLLAELDLSFDDIGDDFLSALEVVSGASATSAIKALGMKGADMLKLANSRAEAWAAARAGELIKGELSEATREFLRGTILEAEQEGWSNAQLAKELRENYAFSRQRAETIARTELKSADSEGAIAGWRASGLKMKKEWLRSANDADCDICESNEAQGPIDLDDTFDSGDDTSPAHPNCECVVVSVVQDEED